MTQEFHITDYGAVAGSDGVQTASIQSAIDACAGAGGGTVVVPAGRFVTGTIDLASHVELHLSRGATLAGSTSLDDYQDFIAPGFRHENAPEKNSKSLIRGIGVIDVAITGPGTIDGGGVAFYDAANRTGKFFAKPLTARPRMVMLYECRDVTIAETTLLDSPCWTCWIMKCERVAVRGVKVLGDQRMINNDGIDIDSSRDVTVSDCIIRTADDCIVVRAIDPMFDTPAPCEYVTVTNCTLDSWCQGIRVGCPGDGVIRNVVFSNLTVRSDNHGISIEHPKRYLPAGSTGSADIHDLLFDNISIEAANLPVRVTVEAGISLRRLSSLTFSSIRTRSGGAFTVTGCPETIVRDVRLSNVVISSSAAPALVTDYCEGMELDGVRLECRT